MKRAWPWLFFLLSLGAFGVIYFMNQEAKAQVRVLNLQMESLKSEVEAANKTRAASLSDAEVQEFTALVQSNRSLPKVRADYQQLKQQKAEALKALQLEQNKVQALEKTLQNTQRSLERPPTPFGAAGAADAANYNACIANLKQMESAKEQLALENRLREDYSPTDAEIYGPDRYIRQKPLCPNGGVYTLNRIADRPTCTIPGHVLR